MLKEINTLIRDDLKLKGLLFGGLLLQVMTCITAVGFFHPDQHFQIIEFSSFQLHTATSATRIWELAAHIRPTIQVYLFSAYTVACQFLHITDPYAQLTLLRLLFGCAVFALFNLMALHYFKEDKKTLYCVLLLLNFSWILPYVRTLFSSEIVSALFFYGALFYYDLSRNSKRSAVAAFVTGFLLALAFFFRFQVAFAIAGFGIWLLLCDRDIKKYKKIGLLIAGFAAGLILNIYLDSGFYHEFVFTPYRYFQVNISEGKAASFGTSSFWVYVGVLVATLAVPPLSLWLLYYGVKGSIKKYIHPLVLPTIFFILGHCLVGHKEERFLFTVFNALPLVIGLGLPYFTDYYRRCNKGIAVVIKATLIFSATLNSLLLVLFACIPYAQTVHFSSLLEKRLSASNQKVYCLARTPFETESGLPLVFYERSAHLQLIKIKATDSLRHKNDAALVATTYNQIKDNKALMDSLGYKPVLFSSGLLWNLNQYLDSKNINTINDIWVLYKKEP